MSKKLGNLGEKIAEKFLKDKGYRIICRNWRCKTGELDIISKDGDILVFVEVKTAGGYKFGDPVEWVTPRKAKKLIASATEFIYRNSINDIPIRFDIVAIDVNSGQITHIKNAFGSGSDYLND